MARNEKILAPEQSGTGSTRLEDACSSVSSLLDERHYTVGELAERWNLSSDTIRRLFENETGVLVLGESGMKRGKRRYTTLRIPESIAKRVHRRLSKV